MQRHQHICLSKKDLHTSLFHFERSGTRRPHFVQNRSRKVKLGRYTSGAPKTCLVDSLSLHNHLILPCDVPQKGPCKHPYGPRRRPAVLNMQRAVYLCHGLTYGTKVNGEIQRTAIVVPVFKLRRPSRRMRKMRALQFTR
jgi:hypothetical protein